MYNKWKVENEIMFRIVGINLNELKYHTHLKPTHTLTHTHTQASN